MSAGQHTPGPWTAEPEIDENGFELGKLWIIMQGQPCAYDFDRVEDARVAAAGPDLLAALEWAATVIRPGTDLREAMDTAIAKARGDA